LCIGVARFFLVHTMYQNGKMYQITLKYTKWPLKKLRPENKPTSSI
jgi:hypothetical protein